MAARGLGAHLRLTDLQPVLDEDIHNTRHHKAAATSKLQQSVAGRGDKLLSERAMFNGLELCVDGSCGVRQTSLLFQINLPLNKGEILMAYYRLVGSVQQQSYVAFFTVFS